MTVEATKWLCIRSSWCVDDLFSPLLIITFRPLNIMTSSVIKIKISFSDFLPHIPSLSYSHILFIITEIKKEIYLFVSKKFLFHRTAIRYTNYTIKLAHTPHIRDVMDNDARFSMFNILLYYYIPILSMLHIRLGEFQRTNIHEYYRQNRKFHQNLNKLIKQSDREKKKRISRF